MARVYLWQSVVNPANILYNQRVSEKTEKQLHWGLVLRLVGRYSLLFKDERTKFNKIRNLLHSGSTKLKTNVLLDLALRLLAKAEF